MVTRDILTDVGSIRAFSFCIVHVFFYFNPIRIKIHDSRFEIQPAASSIPSAFVQHADQRILLVCSNRQIPWVFHCYPHACICAVVWSCQYIISSWPAKGCTNDSAKWKNVLRGGCQSSGPLSPLASFTLSVTAISWGSVRSLANASLSSPLHDAAPDYVYKVNTSRTFCPSERYLHTFHALDNGTTWSISTSDANVQVAPS